MRKIITFTILVVAINQFAIAQQKGLVNDPDGYTNIREGRSSSTKIIGRVLEGQEFLYYTDESSNWWKVKFESENKNTIIGYIHNSRIKPVSDNQTTFLYHEFEPTASDFRILKRNISKEDLPHYYVIESVDLKGRVIELKFCDQGGVISDNLCYLTPWYKFEYPNENTIIVHHFESDGSKQSVFECDTWYKTTYTIDNTKTRILDSEIEYDFDIEKLANYLEWTVEEVNSDLKKRYDNQPKPIIIIGYGKSYSKLNGKFPIREEFEIEDFSYTGLEYEEMKEIIKNYR